MQPHDGRNDDVFGMANVLAAVVVVVVVVEMTDADVTVGQSLRAVVARL